MTKDANLQCSFCVFDSCDPEPNPPSYSEDTVRSTLDYLTQSFSGNTRSLVGVLSKTPVSIG